MVTSLVPRHFHQYKITCENCGKTVVKYNKQQTCSIKCRQELQMKKCLEKTPQECPRRVVVGINKEDLSLITIKEENCGN